VRAAIISSKLLARPVGSPDAFTRWDVAYWLGNQDILDGNRVANAERNLKAAETRLATAKAEKETEEKRVQELLDTGLVKPL